jgi:hypothetical protein
LRGVAKVHNRCFWRRLEAHEQDPPGFFLAAGNFPDGHLTDGVTGKRRNLSLFMAAGNFAAVNDATPRRRLWRGVATK